MSDTDFSKYPISLAERQARKSVDGSLWSPRDALIAALREIDSGQLDPSELIIIARLKEKESGDIRIFNSSSDGLIATGMMAKAMRHFSK
jgi:hypothetical protein